MSTRHSKRLPSVLYGYVYGEDSELTGRLFDIESNKADALFFASSNEDWNGRIGVYKLVKVIRGTDGTPNT